ncbi:MAG TPA: flagellar export chaperone FliS [Solirubrobacteraceae bacterium]|jgi:flagellar protein FliS|nr:flagellar export chaperone FliS [Solirubrobacteraceae bacterium]
MSSLAASPDAYRQGAVLSASPAQLIVMLYDGARRFLRQGAAAMREGDIERAHNTLRRAELIVAYLDGTLDHTQAQIAGELNALYTFCLRHLNDARRTQDATKLEEVSDLLGELREAWVEVARG